MYVCVCVAAGIKGGEKKMWGFAYIREGRRREEREKRIWSMNETEKQAENEQMEAIVTG